MIVRNGNRAVVCVVTLAIMFLAGCVPETTFRASAPTDTPVQSTLTDTQRATLAATQAQTDTQIPVLPEPTPEPSATPTKALPTTTVTEPPRPTSTLVPPTKALPTATVTELPTPTSTLIPPTKVPRPTKVPEVQRQVRVLFSDDFSSGSVVWQTGAVDKWDGSKELGVSMSVVPDPEDSKDTLGNPRGNVAKFVTGDKPVWRDKEQLYWRMGWPSWNGDRTISVVTAPSAVMCDIFIPAGVRTGYGLMSVHRQNPATGESKSVAGFEVGSSGVLRGLARDTNGTDTRKDSVKLPIGRWFTLGMEFRPDGKIIYLLDGKPLFDLNSTLSVPVDGYPAGFYDAHAGIIKSSKVINDGMPAGFTVYNDNFRVVQYDE
jgi:hypothetical protein